MENTVPKKTFENAKPATSTKPTANSRPTPNSRPSSRTNASSSAVNRERMRRRQSRTGRGYQEEKKLTNGEKIMIQCIISGVIFTGVLLFNFIDMEITNDINENLKTAINTKIERQTLEEYAEGAKDNIDSLQNAVKTIFGYENDFIPNDVLKDEVADESISEQIEPDEINEYIDNNFRIDEDIINELNAMEDIYGNDEKK